MIRVEVPAARDRYAVHVAPGLLARAGEHLRSIHDPGPLLVVTDRTVAALYGARFLASARRAGFRPRLTVIPAGERAKSLATVRRICEGWSREPADRSSLVAALGGGVVSDVAGFAAASYARGLPWAIFPTTLLSQADASIGGKVGVNLPAGKNLVGAFHHPRAVFSDPEVLGTLSPRAFRSGLAEVAKMGFIRRPSILGSLHRLARFGSEGSTAGGERLRRAGDLVRATAREKAWYVSRDPYDRGIRRQLNFGHTVGHALETAYGYRAFTHGEAVSIGMAAALRMSVRLAGLNPIDAQEGESLLRSLGLPVRLSARPGAAFWNALRRDKKRGRKRLVMVLSPAIGAAKTFELTSLTPLRDVMQSLVSEG